MSATKKQVNDLENAVVILEERLEKMEEEQQLLKQMITMQSTLIDNLQMMLKMMSVSQQQVSSTYRVMHVGGKAEELQEQSKEQLDQASVNEEDKKEGGDQTDLIKKTSLRYTKNRMMRVM